MPVSRALQAMPTLLKNCGNVTGKLKNSPAFFNALLRSWRFAINRQTDQLSLATDKAFNLLERAVRESEISAEQLQRQNQQMSVSAKSDQRLEQELDERNSVIKNQNSLMERMVSLVESSVSSSPPSKPRKRTFWQRLFGEGKGI